MKKEIVSIANQAIADLDEEIFAAFVYGSRAQGIPRKESDLDLGVIVKGRGHKRKRKIVNGIKVNMRIIGKEALLDDLKKGEHAGRLGFRLSWIVIPVKNSKFIEKVNKMALSYTVKLVFECNNLGFKSKNEIFRRTIAMHIWGHPYLIDTYVRIFKAGKISELKKLYIVIINNMIKKGLIFKKNKLYVMEGMPEKHTHALYNRIRKVIRYYNDKRKMFEDDESFFKSIDRRSVRFSKISKKDEKEFLDYIGWF